MTDEQAKKLNDEKKGNELPELTEELSEEELSGLSGGFKFHEHKQNPTQVPISQGLDD